MLELFVVKGIVRVWLHKSKRCLTRLKAHRIFDRTEGNRTNNQAAIKLEDLRVGAIVQVTGSRFVQKVTGD